MGSRVRAISSIARFGPVPRAARKCPAAALVVAPGRYTLRTRIAGSSTPNGAPTSRGRGRSCHDASAVMIRALLVLHRCCRNGSMTQPRRGLCGRGAAPRLVPEPGFARMDVEPTLPYVAFRRRGDGPDLTAPRRRASFIDFLLTPAQGKAAIITWRASPLLGTGHRLVDHLLGEFESGHTREDAR
jgi:hypothetical protein